MLNANSLFSKYKKNYFCPILKKAILMLFDAFDAFGSFGSAWKWFEQWKMFYLVSVHEILVRDR